MNTQYTLRLKINKVPNRNAAQTEELPVAFTKHDDYNNK
jgi:hypothetical protein